MTERPSDEEIEARRAHRRASKAGGRLANFRRQNTYYLRGILTDPTARPVVKADAQIAYDEKMIVTYDEREKLRPYLQGWQLDSIKRKFGVDPSGNTPEGYEAWLKYWTMYSDGNEMQLYLKKLYETGHSGRSTSDWQYTTLINYMARKRLGL